MIIEAGAPIECGVGKFLVEGLTGRRKRWCNRREVIHSARLKRSASRPLKALAFTGETAAQGELELVGDFVVRLSERGIGVGDLAVLVRHDLGDTVSRAGAAEEEIAIEQDGNRLVLVEGLTQIVEAEN